MNGLKNSIFCTLIFLCLFVCCRLQAQQGTIYGRVTDNGKPLQLVNVVCAENGTTGTTTDEKGYYELSLPADTTIQVVASFIGYKNAYINVKLKPGESRKFDIHMVVSSQDLETIVIEDETIRNTTFDRINAKAALMIPNASNDIGAVIKTLPGVSSVNELSSQYSVRGGNFDENIIYVNGIEVFKPFLTRSGQQEGLSFVNSDLVSSISFSAGGFEPKYGDKMSSVLDITYRKPTEFHASLSLGLLASSIHVEDKLDNFTYLVGFRYKSNAYLINTMDTKGDYNPTYTDFQTLLTYSVSPKLEISLLGNYSGNKYSYVPQSRETTFGSLMESYRMYMYMEGNENDVFRNGMAALSLLYKPQKISNISLTFSGYNSIESEYYDVLSEYWIGKLDNNMGSDDYGNVVESMGVGTFLSHARNRYKSQFYTADAKYSTVYGNHNLSFGAQYRHESVYDVLSEWELVDSAGYTIPTTPDSIGFTDPSQQPEFILSMYSSANAKNTLNCHRASAYAQDMWSFELPSVNMNLTYGLRFSYLSVNKEFDVSPRLTFSLIPKKWSKDVLFRFSTGYYFQQPSYREMRDENGVLHTDIKSQKSIHFVAGCDWNLRIWNRPFKFVTEAYYKLLDDLIPYTVDNVMIQYYPDMLAEGYATGIDVKLTGEMVKGVDSWVSVSLMKTMERQIDSVGNVISDYYPRPTDQRFMFSLFLQDYVPNYPHIKMQLNLTYGTGLPAMPPNKRPFSSSYTRRYPSYLRADLGLSWQIVSDKVKTHTFLDALSDMSLTVEVLNVLDKYNTISYTWVTDIRGYQCGVPDYLTRRAINIKLSVKY